MKRTGAKGLVLITGAALALSACATSSSGGSGSTPSAAVTTAPITFTWGYEQEFAAYNQNTAEQYSSANAVVLNQVIRGFWYFGPDGSIIPDKEFGTYTKTSDNPLTIKYTFADKAAWSDGNPLDCDDAVLVWLANNGKSGKGGFSAAGTQGYEDQQKPQCKDGDKSFTVVYNKPFADWEGLYGGAFIPAHLVEKGAGVTDIIAAADSPTGPDSLKAAKYYNTAWNFDPGTLKPEISPAAGPYTLSKWVPKQSITLEANPKWWGTPPKAKTIVIRYIAGSQQAQALQNGEINAMDPQPQADLIKQLQGMSKQVNVSTGDQYTYEHIDFNFASIFKDPNVRLAFAKCLPRQQIVDNLIKPINPKVELFDSRWIFPFQPQYKDYISSLGADKYATVDIPGAKSLLAAAKVSNPTVRIGWRKDPAQLNQRRADQVSLIQASCNQAGFKVVDSGTPDFFDNAWPKDNYDVAMFAWAGSPLVTSGVSAWQTGGGQNPGKYSNPTVDADIKALSQETDHDKQLVITKKLDTELWADLMTIPLYAFPAVLGTSKNAEGVQFNATQADLTWNAFNWSLKQ